MLMENQFDVQLLPKGVVLFCLLHQLTVSASSLMQA